MKSEQAKAALEIRKQLKAMGLKCSVTSDSGSMTSSVNVKIYNQQPGMVKKVKKLSDQYQYGHFDGMTDMYEYSNRRKDIPQAKYVFVSNQIDDETHQKAWDFIRPIYAGAEELPEKYSDLHAGARLFNDRATTIIYQFLNGYLDEKNSQKFWESIYPATETKKEKCSQATTSEGATIEEHIHSKRGFKMFLCRLSDRVEKSKFMELLEHAKSLNGWYSMKWEKTPAGFAFKEKESALKFLKKISLPGKPEESKSQPAKTEVKVKVKTNFHEKLRDLADGMQSEIDSKFADRETNTPSRLAQANHARLDGERLERTQKALRGLAVLHETGTLPEILNKFTSKKSVYDLMGTKKNMVPSGFHTYYACTGEPNSDTPEARALWSLLEGKTEEQKQKEKLQHKIDGLQFSKIPGYFPTPDNVIDKMIKYADLEDNQRILEPSAGSSAIADRIKSTFKINLHCCESNFTLREILTGKNYDVKANDFLNYLAPGFYDRIIMNPPFENKQDIRHIKHAIRCLKPGGKIVAICANGPNQQKELMSIADHWEELPQGSFKSSGTGVNTALLVINN